MKKTYVVDWARGHYGHNARLWFNGKKLFVAGGGGYCKETACLEEAIKHALGKYISMGSFDNENYINEKFKEAGIEATYSITTGRNESILTIETKED